MTKSLEDIKRESEDAFSIVDRYFTIPQLNQFRIERNTLIEKVWNAALDACREKDDKTRAWIETVISNAEALAFLSSAEDASNIRNNVIFPLGTALSTLEGKEN